MWSKSSRRNKKVPKKTRKGEIEDYIKLVDFHCGFSLHGLSWTTSILLREVWYGLEFEPVQYVNPYHDPPLYKPTKPPSPR